LQATIGDNTTEKPGMFSGFEAGYKWQAWEDNKGKICCTNKRRQPQLHVRLCCPICPRCEILLCVLGSGTSEEDAKAAYVAEVKAQAAEFH
jgi:acyl-CoA-binding protein